MLITHGHFDHMQDAVHVGKKTDALVVGAFEIVSFLQTKGVKNGNPMNKGGTDTLPGSEIKVTMTHADHTSSIQDGSHTLPGGEPVGFVIEFENGYKIYNTGDTAVFGDMKLIGELYTPDLVMMPIGDHFTMGPKEAAMACRLIEAKRVIPQHYGTFPQLTGTVEAFQQLLVSQSVEVIAMKPGEAITLP
jgi:L-ascorbate metabolism protein UlaG (beta-lactamase superfamily)